LKLIDSYFLFFLELTEDHDDAFLFCLLDFISKQGIKIQHKRARYHPNWDKDRYVKINFSCKPG
jgi:hypothetical protein